MPIMHATATAAIMATSVVPNANADGSSGSIGCAADTAGPTPMAVSAYEA